MIITIDGPSGTGKSTIAKSVAKRLNMIHFDTGAMYRALAWATFHYTIDENDPIAIVSLAQEHPISFKNLHGTSLSVFFGSHDVTQYIRTEQISQRASKISTYKEVRDELVRIQRMLGHSCNAVFDGRDMGTVVFPDAEIKIFLTANDSIRAERRYKELVEKDTQVEYCDILESIIKRDTQDSTRACSPLRPAVDAHIIDTSLLTIDQVLNAILAIVHQKNS